MSDKKILHFSYLLKKKCSNLYNTHKHNSLSFPYKKLMNLIYNISYLNCIL